MRASLKLSGVLGVVFFGTISTAADKRDVITGDKGSSVSEANVFARPDAAKRAIQTVATNGAVEVPVVVVHGAPYEMGRQLGAAMQSEIQQFVPQALEALCAETKLSQETLCEVWARTAAYADDRVEQELAGLADGSGVSLATLQALHAAPLVMPYSCSSIAAWGDATEDGHLYQTRNLDWSLEVGAHEHPVIVVYVPDEGIPHVVPSFAGVVGAHTGMNAKGIVLSEMGDAPEKEAPYFVHAPHFTIYFRTMLYDGDSLARALEIFQSQPMTKRYHFVFGDGRTDKRGVKIRAHAPETPGEQLKIWRDNDSSDEFAPNVLSCVVYNDEGRGAFPMLKADFGKLNGEKLVDLANRIPIKGGNVVNVVYDATALRMWVTYAKGDQEAYQRPSVFLDLKNLETSFGETALAN